MKIAYEPHPVSPERKAELRAQGYKIIDARYAPVQDPAIPSREEIGTMKEAEIVVWLEAHGVTDPKGSVADLRDALVSIMYLEA